MLGYMDRAALDADAGHAARSRSSAAAGSACGPRARAAATSSTWCRSRPTATATRCWCRRARRGRPAISAAPAAFPRRRRLPGRARRAGRRARARAPRRQLHHATVRGGVRRIAQKVGEEGVETGAGGGGRRTTRRCWRGRRPDVPPARAAARARAVAGRCRRRCSNAGTAEPRLIAGCPLRSRAMHPAVSPACALLLSMRVRCRCVAVDASLPRRGPASHATRRSVFHGSQRQRRARSGRTGHRRRRASPTASASSRTDADGRYRLAARRWPQRVPDQARRLSRRPLRADGLPDTWVNLQPRRVRRCVRRHAHGARRCRDFALQPIAHKRQAAWTCWCSATRRPNRWPTSTTTRATSSRPCCGTSRGATWASAWATWSTTTCRCIRR